MFDTVYTRMKRVNDFVCSAGIQFEPTYKYEIVEGVKNLVQDGTVDRQAVIDSYAEASDIHVIVQRFLNGDTSVLSQRPAQYLDVTDMPKTYAEMFDIVQNGTAYFESLPDDVRKEFDNNPYNFFKDIGTDQFSEKISKFVSQDVPSESEVNDNAE